jgi:hypothetical protein
VFSYRVFADNLSGTFSQLDAHHANSTALRFSSTSSGGSPRPPPHRRPAEGMESRERPSTSLDQTDFDFETTTCSSTRRPRSRRTSTCDIHRGGCEYRIVAHQLEGRHGSDRLPPTSRRSSRRERGDGRAAGPQALHFLVHFAPRAGAADGMEHLTSTKSCNTFALDYDKSYDAALSVTAHEFFHVWNVKRLRPIELGPWTTRARTTRRHCGSPRAHELLRRPSRSRGAALHGAGVLRELAEEIATLENSPGRLTMSLERSSFDSWLFLATRARQRTNNRGRRSATTTRRGRRARSSTSRSVAGRTVRNRSTTSFG